MDVRVYEVTKITSDEFIFRTREDLEKILRECEEDDDYTIFLFHWQQGKKRYTKVFRARDIWDEVTSGDVSFEAMEDIPKK